MHYRRASQCTTGYLNWSSSSFSQAHCGQKLFHELPLFLFSLVANTKGRIHPKINLRLNISNLRYIMIFWISKSTSEFYYRILMNLLLNTYIIVSTVSKICMRMDIHLYEIAFESGLPVLNINIIVRIVQ